MDIESTRQITLAFPQNEAGDDDNNDSDNDNNVEDVIRNDMRVISIHNKIKAGNMCERAREYA